MGFEGFDIREFFRMVRVTTTSKLQLSAQALNDAVSLQKAEICQVSGDEADKELPVGSDDDLVAAVYHDLSEKHRRS